MKIVIDTEAATLTCRTEEGDAVLPLYSPEAFELLTRQWERVGWNQKYSYRFTWMGQPIIQLPEDLVRVQEAVFAARPDVVVETGVAHGGSLVYYASLLKMTGGRRIVGVDVEIRPHNRRAIEEHPLAGMIALVEGDSTDPATVAKVRGLLREGESVLVVLDSDHSRGHVARELEAYHGLVTPGSWLIVADGIMADLTEVPRGKAAWKQDNPAAAAREFARAHPEFALEPPAPPFDESEVASDPSYLRGGWLRRL